MTSPKPHLNKALAESLGLPVLPAAPIRIIQFGEGVFLRGFFLPLINNLRHQGLFNGSVAVIKPRPGLAKVETFRQQDNLYTLQTQGKQNGTTINRRELISTISQIYDPATHWSEVKTLFESPDLQIITSNTTESGFALSPEDTQTHPHSFPAKLILLLHHRYIHFQGSPTAALHFLPTELLENNAATLRAALLTTAQKFNLSEPFQHWLHACNTFSNTLVDRIVTAAPNPALPYHDDLLTTAEPFHFFAIDTTPSLQSILPLEKAQEFTTIWTEDLPTYRLRKLRILNGLHTLLAPLGLLASLTTVAETMSHPAFRSFLQATLKNEILPTLPNEEEFSNQTLERFENPFLGHQLADIATNLPAKWRIRILPTMKDNLAKFDQIPPRLILGLAALLQLKQLGIETLADISLWGEDLTQLPTLTTATTQAITALRSHSIDHILQDPRYA